MKRIERREEEEERKKKREGGKRGKTYQSVQRLEGC